MTKNVTAIIDGTETIIIPVITQYNMDRTKLKQEELDCLNPDSLLDVIFHLADPQPFRDECIPLYTLDGEEVSLDAENVFVVMDTPDTHWRYSLKAPLKHVQVHKFSTVEEYASTISDSTYGSRGYTKLEQIGIVALKTGNEALKEIHDFALEHDMSPTVAELYLNTKISSSTIKKVRLHGKTKDIPVLQRSREDADRLFAATSLTFSNKEAKKSYVIKVCNALLEHFSLDLLIRALELIPSQEIVKNQMDKCNGRESCLSCSISSFINQLEQPQAA